MTIHIALIYPVNYTEVTSRRDRLSCVLETTGNDTKKTSCKSEKNLKHVRFFYYIKISYIVFFKFTKIYS